VLERYGTAALLHRDADFLPDVARVSVLRTYPVLTRSPHSSPYGVMAFAVSTPPSFERPPPSSLHGIWGFAVSTPPVSPGGPLFCLVMSRSPLLSPRSFAGTPSRPPTCLPRPFDHRIHSHTPRFERGFSDLPHSLLGVRPRLSPHPGHDDWNPGQRGFQTSCLQDPCQIIEI
jgi:hypothetical protein